MAKKNKQKVIKSRRHKITLRERIEREKEKKQQELREKQELEYHREKLKKAFPNKKDRIEYLKTLDKALDTEPYYPPEQTKR